MYLILTSIKNAFFLNKKEGFSLKAKMGYDDDECPICYMTGQGNFEPDSTQLVCGKCINYMMDPDLYGSTPRLASSFKVAASDCGKNDVVCFLCNKHRYFVFEVPCCKEHEGMY